MRPNVPVLVVEARQRKPERRRPQQFVRQRSRAELKLRHVYDCRCRGRHGHRAVWGERRRVEGCDVPGSEGVAGFNLERFESASSRPRAGAAKKDVVRSIEKLSGAAREKKEIYTSE